MLYRNRNNGRVIDVTSALISEVWEAVEEPPLSSLPKDKEQEKKAIKNAGKRESGKRK